MNRPPVPVTHPGIQHPNNTRKENLPQVKGASAFHELKFLQADQRRAQWLCLSQLTLILFQAKEADKHCDTACQRMLNNYYLLCASIFCHHCHSAYPPHSENQWLGYCQPAAPENTTQSRETAEFPSWNEERGTAVIWILKVWNKLWRWWLSQYLGSRNRSLALSLNPTCTT